MEISHEKLIDISTYPSKIVPDLTTCFLAAGELGMLNYSCMF